MLIKSLGFIFFRSKKKKAVKRSYYSPLAQLGSTSGKLLLPSGGYFYPDEEA